MKLKCKNKCFYNSRLYSPGEAMVIPDGEEIPKHFVPAAQMPDEVEEKEEPKTLSQIQIEEAQSLLDSFEQVEVKPEEQEEADNIDGEEDILE